MQQLLLVFHVLIAVALVVLILLQQGKGAEMGASFGSGASQTLFGSRGSSSFLLKLTGFFAALFFISSLILGYLAGHQSRPDILQNLSGMPASSAAPTIPTQTQSPPAELPPLQQAQDNIQKKH
jgi:preprotein translocase subunit SecG